MIITKIIHIHLDAVGGLAGDMFVAALLDALPELHQRVFADLAAVMPAHSGQPSLSDGVTCGIAARRFALGGTKGKICDNHHDHEHSEYSYDHPVHFPEIIELITTADLQAGTASQATAILRRLAEAESRIHRVPVEKVHFHEIADWDSLMDLVAAGSIVAALPHCRWSVSDLPRGDGLVLTRHGLLPIPAPATAEILRGFRWRDDGIGGERVTPTGAVILAHLVHPAGAPRPGGLLHATGTGAGTRELSGMPNILRALVFSDDDTKEQLTDTAVEVRVINFDIDDMTGEEIAIASDRLRTTDGVIDLTTGTRHGKKGRSVSDFRLLVKPAAFDSVCRQCFLETSTLGLRWRTEQRRCLQRAQEAVHVDGEQLSRKRTYRPEGLTSLKIESDEIARHAGLVTRRHLKHLGEFEDEDEDA